MTSRSNPENRDRIEPKMGNVISTDLDADDTSESKSPGELNQGARVSQGGQPAAYAAHSSHRKNLSSGGGGPGKAVWFTLFMVQALLVAGLIFLFASHQKSSQRVQVLQTQLDTMANKSNVLEEGLSETGQTLNKTEGAFESRLSKVSDNLAATMDKMDMLSKNVTSQSSTATEVNQQVLGLEKKVLSNISSLDSQVKTIKSDVSSQSGKIADLEVFGEKFSLFEKKAIQLEKKIDKDLRQVKKAVSSQKDATEKLASFQASINSVDVFRKQTNQTLDDLERNINVISRRLKSLESPGTPVRDDDIQLDYPF